MIVIVPLQYCSKVYCSIICKQFDNILIISLLLCFIYSLAIQLNIILYAQYTPYFLNFPRKSTISSINTLLLLFWILYFYFLDSLPQVNFDLSFQILFELQQLNANFLPTLSEDLYLPNFFRRNIPKNNNNNSLSSFAILHNILNPKYLSINLYFYLTSHLSTNSTQPITYNYKYHIEIVTSTSTYLYTNLYTYSSSRSISIQQSDDNSVNNFKIKWSKSNTDQRVIRAHITLFFNFVANGATQLGMASGKINGYNIAQGSIAGYLTIESGTGQTVITQNNLTLNGYNLLTTQMQMSQSRNFLNYQYSSLPINLPSDLVSITMVTNYGSYLSSNDIPSVLGQLVWSWIQYFPIFLTIYFILDKSFCFLLNEKIVRSSLVHDKEYLQLIEQQNNRRQKLRLK